MALGLEERISLGWLALSRIVAGGVLLAAGVQKVLARFDAEALSAELAAFHPFEFAQQAIERWVAPRLDLFATLATAGELAAGVSLLLGLASRLGALAGLLLNVAWFLVSRETINLVLIPVHLGVLFAGGGRALGLDGALKRRWPWWFLG